VSPAEEARRPFAGTPRIDKLRAEVEAAPDSPVAHMRLGTALLKLGEGREAESELRRALELDESYAEAGVNLGGLLLGRWDFAGCVDANRRAAALRPDLLHAPYNQGLGHLYLGQAREMVECFERVIEIDADHPGGTYHLAVGHLALGRVEEARIGLEKARRLGFSPQPEFLKALEREEQKNRKRTVGGHVATIEIDPGRSDRNSREHGNSRDRS
jgi:Flp pilus assembly protein TadD